MAKMFYTAEEAAAKLGTTVEAIAGLVKSGKLREFRDGSTVRYKVEDVDGLAPGSSDDSAIVLEPAEDSGVVLAASGSDVLSLAEVESDDPAEDTRTTQKKDPRGDTAVSSVGVSVFDDDELDEVVDPLAQTAVSDVAGLGLDGVGSGSGILDLTRESDDTSLGAELLDEIYSPEDEGTVEMGEATRAGLDEAITEPSSTRGEEASEIFSPATAKATAAGRGRTVTQVSFAPDALSSSLTALMVVVMFVMLFGGLAAASLVRGVTPRIIESIFQNMMVYAGGVAGVAVVASAVTFFLAKRAQ
ncbi:MAG: helix-turn-helix domain-containing protein [Planctomycetes bacterium]|nr:helix-turn-helix domain-containing protein [Planctomycetota bacterium]